jgi:hypothetical protein
VVVRELGWIRREREGKEGAREGKGQTVYF